MLSLNYPNVQIMSKTLADRKLVIVCTSPFLLGRLSLLPNFQKRGRGLTGSQKLKKRGVRTLLPTMKNSSKDSSEQYWDLDKVTKKKHYTSVSITKWFELYLGNRAFFVATAKVFWEQMYFTCAAVKYPKDCETMDGSADPYFTAIHSWFHSRSIQCLY